MARVAWTGKLQADKIDRYIEVHANIPPEMLAMIKDAGVRNYSIHLSGDRVFGYYECDDPEAALAQMNASEVARRWGASVGVVWESEVRTRGLDYMREVFRLD